MRNGGFEGLVVLGIFQRPDHRRYGETVAPCIAAGALLLGLLGGRSTSGRELFDLTIEIALHFASYTICDSFYNFAQSDLSHSTRNQSRAIKLETDAVLRIVINPHNASVSLCEAIDFLRRYARSIYLGCGKHLLHGFSLDQTFYCSVDNCTQVSVQHKLLFRKIIAQ